MTAVLDAVPESVPSSGDTDPPLRRPGPGPGRLVVGLSAAALLAVLVAALLVGGGAPAPAVPGLPDAGAVVGWGRPVVSLLTRLLAVLAVGSLLVAAVLLPAPGGVLPPGSRRAVRTAVGAGLAWAACEAAALVLLTGSLLGRPVTRVVAGDVRAVATGLPAGRTGLAVVALLLLVVLLAVALLAVTANGAGSRGALPVRVLLLLTLAAVVLPVVTTGHSATAGAHRATVSVLAVHVVAASLWTGGLLGLLLHLRDAGAERAVAVMRLSRLALGCVVAVTATGVVGAALVTDVSVPALLGSGYGSLLLAKTGAVALLVGAGWAHRRRTLPLLRAGARGAFVRLAVVETGLMAATLAIAVGLSSAPPPADPTPPAPTVAPTSETLDQGRVDRDQDQDQDQEQDQDQAGLVGTAAPAAPDEKRVGVPVAEDMARHDHGELSVSVLVDDERLHVGAPVQAGTPVTVYNTGAQEVVLRAEDGSFDAVVPSRTFITFLAPPEPGGYAFGDPGDSRYADVLQVAAPQG